MVYLHFKFPQLKSCHYSDIICVMKIFHGSQSIVKVPQYGIGKVGNDFGLGFYCTENENMAMEWSVQPTVSQ